LPSQRRKSRRFGDESEIVLLDCGEPAFDNFLQIEPIGPGRCLVAKLLTKDEARRIAANIAKLPALARYCAVPKS